MTSSDPLQSSHKPTLQTELNGSKRSRSISTSVPSDSSSKARKDSISMSAPQSGGRITRSTEKKQGESSTKETKADETNQSVEDDLVVKIDSLSNLSEMYENNQLQSNENSSIEFEPNSQLNNKIILWQGDITSLKVDCIVNAANKSLLGGGGVDAAIHRAAGPGLLVECRTLHGAETGQVKLSGGYDLPAKKVAHAVGPVYSRSKKEQCEKLLRSCYRNTLELCVNNNLRTVAFSAISTGVYGYPLNDAIPAVLDEVRQFLDGGKGDKIDSVIFTVFQRKHIESYSHFLPIYFPRPKQNKGGVESEQEVKSGESEITAGEDIAVKGSASEQVVKEAKERDEERETIR